MNRKPYFEIFAAVWFSAALMYIHNVVVIPAVQAGFCRQICAGPILTTFTFLTTILAVLTLILSRENRLPRSLITFALPAAAIGDAQILAGRDGIGALLFAVAILSVMAGTIMSDQITSERMMPWCNWTPRKAWILLSIIVFITLFLRLYRIGFTLEGPAYDEAVKGFVAIDILEGRQAFKPFLQYRESLFFYIIALGFKIFGVSLTTMRVTTTMVTVTALFLMYYYLKSRFNREAAIVSSLFMAVSLWHCSFSRITQRPVLVILFQILIMIIVSGIYRKRCGWHYPALGICIGLGFYSYPPIKFFYLSLVPVFLYIYIKDRKQLLKHIPGILITTTLVLACLMVPLGQHALEFPDYFFTSKKLGYKDSIQTAGISEVKHHAVLLLKTWHKNPAPGGTMRPVNALFPLLDPIIGIFMITGLGVILARIRRFNYFFLVMILLFGILPGLVVYPFQRRLITATFVMFPVAGIGFLFFWEQLRRAVTHRDRFTRTLPYLVAASLFFPMYTGWGILQDKLYSADLTYSTYMPMEYAGKLFQDGYIINYIGSPHLPMFRFALYDEHQRYPGTGMDRFFYGKQVTIPFENRTDRNIVYILLAKGLYPRDKQKEIEKYYPHAVQEKHYWKGSLVFKSFRISNADVRTVQEALFSDETENGRDKPGRDQ